MRGSRPRSFSIRSMLDFSLVSRGSYRVEEFRECS